MTKRSNSPDILSSQGVIDVGSLVEIQFVGDPDGETETFQLIEPHKDARTEDLRNTITTAAPLGKVIIGKEAGANVDFQGPDGNFISVKIVSVR